MQSRYPIRAERRRPRPRGLRGLGFPVLPDNFTTAAGVPWSFSPSTPDAIQMSVLQSAGQQLPADLAAKWAASQGNLVPATVPVTISPTPTPLPVTTAVTPSGTAVSTQSGAAITLKSTIAVAPGVWNCLMSDGSSHYCDVNANPISYTPPAAPVATPAGSSQPTSTVAPVVAWPTFVGPPAQAPGAVTPGGAPISTTTGTPASGTVIASVQGEIDSLMTWLKGSLIGGIPNWLLVGGAVAGLMMFGGDGGSSRRRR